MNQRIEPQHDDQGHPVDLSPPCGGNWLREADGGLRPADAATAKAAGLAWVDDAAAQATAAKE